MVQREARLRDVLKRHGEAGVAELAAELGVSAMTLRRDLDRLERAGLVRRTHGGAVLAERLGFAFDFSARRQVNHKAKQAIAAEAARLVKPGDVVLLDAGTTTLELAVLLRDVADLVVVTPSLAVASELQFSAGVKTILLGGMLRSGLEDTFYLPGGERAGGNGALIEALAACARRAGRAIASPVEARALLGLGAP